VSIRWGLRLEPNYVGFSCGDHNTCLILLPGKLIPFAKTTRRDIEQLANAVLCIAKTPASLSRRASGMEDRFSVFISTMIQMGIVGSKEGGVPDKFV
jgi:hypothetical protein